MTTVLLLQSLAFAPTPHVPLRGLAAPRLHAPIAAADPFADAVFNTAVVQQTADASSQGGYHIAANPPPGDHSTLLTGLIFYVATMALLTAWEEVIIPKLQDAGVVPEIPGTVRYIRHKRLSKLGRQLPWATPLMADRTLPTLEEIQKKAVRVYSNSGVVQLIRAHTAAEQREPFQDERPINGDEFEADEVCAVCRVSPEFSEFYNHRVFVCKRMVDAPALETA